MAVRRRVYVAFDYDDLDLKENFIAQSKAPDCPFDLVDGSIAKAVPVHWEQEARRLIASADCLVVLCGTQTHQAMGASVELKIAQELGKPYFLVAGSRRARPTRPSQARATDKIWRWTWPTLETLLNGGVPPNDASV